MRAQIAIIIDALILSVLTQTVKKMSDEKREMLLAESADWAINEIVKIIQGNSNESNDTPFIG